MLFTNPDKPNWKNRVRFEDFVHAYHMHGNTVFSYMDHFKMAELWAVANHYCIVALLHDLYAPFDSAVIEMRDAITDSTRFDQTIAKCTYTMLSEKLSNNIFFIMNKDVPKYYTSNVSDDDFKMLDDTHPNNLVS